MDHKALATLIVRLAGLWQLVVALNAVPNAIGPFINPEYVRTAGVGWLLFAAFFSIGIPLALGLFLIYFPKTVTESVLRLPGIAPERPPEALLLERTLVSVLGLWLAVDAVLDSVHDVLRWRLLMRMGEIQFPGARAPDFAPEQLAGLLTALVQLAFGLWLMLGSRGIVSALARLRG